MGAMINRRRVMGNGMKIERVNGIIFKSLTALVPVASKNFTVSLECKLEAGMYGNFYQVNTIPIVSWRNYPVLVVAMAEKNDNANITTHCNNVYTRGNYINATQRAKYYQNENWKIYRNGTLVNNNNLKQNLENGTWFYLGNQKISIYGDVVVTVDGNTVLDAYTARKDNELGFYDNISHKFIVVEDAIEVNN